jgi:4'-phosphopantetheinyl transferase
MNPVTNWTRPPQPLQLEKGLIHVWRASLEVPPDSLQRLSELLTSEESLRAGRFVQQRDKHHFIVGRALLRTLLGGYLNLPPTSITLQVQQFGKLALAANHQPCPLQFNLSHSHGMAVYAFATDHELGIDIEWHRSEIAREEIATRYFSIHERQELLALSHSGRVQGFFNAWTRKESYIKAHGKGLQIPLESFDVSLAPGAPAVLRAADSHRWKIYSFTPAVNFTAALTIAVGDWELTFYDADTLLS